jgi:hypothetical protein
LSVSCDEAARAGAVVAWLTEVADMSVDTVLILYDVHALSESTLNSSSQVGASR